MKKIILFSIINISSIIFSMNTNTQEPILKFPSKEIMLVKLDIETGYILKKINAFEVIENKTLPLSQAEKLMDQAITEYNSGCRENKNIYLSHQQLKESKQALIKIGTATGFKFAKL